MSTPAEIRENGTAICYDSGLLSTMEPDLFDADWLRANGHWQGSSQGRNQAHFLTFAECDMVLRHFHRGGLMGRVNRDLFLRCGAQYSRAFREFNLLTLMRTKGLSVPRPVAARYAPSALFYRADIITERIPNARTLAEVLGDAPLSSPLWNAIGVAIKKLHTSRIDHTDLNCRNIMLDDSGVVWLIDFDKCAQRDPGPWMQSNLDRLERSLKKLRNASANFHWVEKDWDALLTGYAQ